MFYTSKKVSVRQKRNFYLESLINIIITQQEKLLTYYKVNNNMIENKLTKGQ